MTDTNSSLNEQTKVANLDEAKEAIQSIEAQLLELKSCIRSIEAVEQPTYTVDELRALARKFFLLGAESQKENYSVSDFDYEVDVEARAYGDCWNINGNVSIDGDSAAEHIEFDTVFISDNEIDEQLKS